MPEAPVLIVRTDQTEVEANPVAGLLGCPPCGGVRPPPGR